MDSQLNWSFLAAEGIYEAGVQAFSYKCRFFRGFVMTVNPTVTL